MQLWNVVIDAVLTNVANARSEATKVKNQWIKLLACGYRNRERFRNAIYFDLGGLDLYPGRAGCSHEILKVLPLQRCLCGYILTRVGRS